MKVVFEEQKKSNIKICERVMIMIYKYSVILIENKTVSRVGKILSAHCKLYSYTKDIKYDFPSFFYSEITLKVDSAETTKKCHYTQVHDTGFET